MSVSVISKQGQPLAVVFRGPLGGSSGGGMYFATLVEAQNYASSPAAIVGQEIKVVTANSNEPIETYEIQKDKTLKPLLSGTSYWLLD